MLARLWAWLGVSIILPLADQIYSLKANAFAFGDTVWANARVKLLVNGLELIKVKRAPVEPRLGVAAHARNVAIFDQVGGVDAELVTASVHARFVRVLPSRQIVRHAVSHTRSALQVEPTTAFDDYSYPIPAIIGAFLVNLAPKPSDFAVFQWLQRGYHEFSISGKLGMNQ